MLTALNNGLLMLNSPVVSCEAIVFDDFPPSDDQIIRALAVPCEFDSTVQEILQVIFCAISSLLRRLLEDHLPGGDLYRHAK